MIATRRKIYTDKLLDNLLDAQKNMASAEKVDAKGLVYLSRFILRLLKKLDDEVIELCAEAEEISGDLIGFTKPVAKTICEEFGIDMEDDAWKD